MTAPDEPIREIRLDNVELGDITPKSFSSFIAKEDTNDFVTKFKTRVSGYLAVGLWSSLVACGAWHAERVGYITHQMLSFSSSINTVTASQDTELDYEPFDKAFVMVGDTAKTLYAVVSPLATAATGFYFVAKSTESPRNFQEDDDE